MQLPSLEAIIVAVVDAVAVVHVVVFMAMVVVLADACTNISPSLFPPALFEL